MMVHQKGSRQSVCSNLDAERQARSISGRLKSLLKLELSTSGCMLFVRVWLGTLMVCSFCHLSKVSSLGTDIADCLDGSNDLCGRFDGIHSCHGIRTQGGLSFVAIETLS